MFKIHKASNQFINRFIRCIKLSTIILCVISCMINSLAIFRQFAENKTITSFNEENHSKIHFPSITLCNRTAFKQRITSIDGLKMKNFLNNTINIYDLITRVHYDKDFLWINESFNGESFKSDTWNIRTVYTRFQGRCFTIEYLIQVFSKKNDNVKLKKLDTTLYETI